MLGLPALSLFDQRRSAALASSRMRWDEPDAAPSKKLNRILGYDVRGWGHDFLVCDVLTSSALRWE